MSDSLAGNLEAAAKALNTPPALVQRSAEARAKATGVSVEEVLAAWAGGTSPADRVLSTESPVSEPVATAPPAPQPATPGPTVAPPRATIPVAEAVVVTPTAAAPPPPPKTVTVAEAGRYPVVVTVPTAGLTERTASGVPRWLAAVSLAVSVFGLLYLAGNAQGIDCGTGGLLSVDRQTGILENCDGSQFAGRGTPGANVDFLSLGQSIYLGRAVAGVNCSGCHQPDGSGGQFPQLSGGSVLLTFSKCEAHLEWVRLGSSNSPGNTYGDPNKPKRGGMPAFAASLTDEQLRSVVFFERVVFGGAPEADTEIECGLAAPADGEAPAEGGAPAEGEAPATETTAPPA